MGIFTNGQFLNVSNFFDPDFINCYYVATTKSQKRAIKEKSKIVVSYSLK